MELVILIIAVISLVVCIIGNFLLLKSITMDKINGSNLACIGSILIITALMIGIILSFMI